MMDAAEAALRRFGAVSVRVPTGSPPLTYRSPLSSYLLTVVGPLLCFSLHLV